MAGTLVVSLDFELFWGMLDVCTLDEYRANVLGGRKAIPQLLRLFEKYNIHATWAAVGFLFAQGPEELRKFFPECRPGYREKKLNPYPLIPQISAEDAPCFFAPDLIDLIAQTPGQEIGSHTFCHYYCREAGQTVEEFAADMAAAKAIARQKGYDVKSVVLPRNQCEPAYTEVLRKLGFTVYRDEENDWIYKKVKSGILFKILRTLDMYLPLTGQGGYTPKCEGGIWNFTGSRMYRPMKPHLPLEGLKIRRIKRQMLHAAKNGLTFHLWWHPHNVGVRTEEHLKQLEEIFSYYEELNRAYGMRCLNMREAAEELSGQEG